MAERTSPSLWSGMDRKALAIGEFTLRQQRKRLSTWVVLLVGLAAMGVLTMFYIDAMTRDYEAIDNDGDSYDWDNDGYPNGQEFLYGTSNDSKKTNSSLKAHVLSAVG